MTTDKPEPPSPPADKPEQEQNSAQPQPEKLPSLSSLDLTKLPLGARISAVTFPSAQRWEWDKDGKRTVFKPQ